MAKVRPRATPSSYSAPAHTTSALLLLSFLPSLHCSPMISSQSLCLLNGFASTLQAGTEPIASRLVPVSVPDCALQCPIPSQLVPVFVLHCQDWFPISFVPHLCVPEQSRQQLLFFHLKIVCISTVCVRTQDDQSLLRFRRAPRATKSKPHRTEKHECLQSR